MNTKFTSIPFESRGFRFTIDGNSKVTAGNGSFEAPTPNALSLRHILDCPQSTPACRATCYVHGLRADKPALWAQYEENSRELRRLLEASETERALVALDLAMWIRVNAAGGWRWHISGDIISTVHAEWIGDVSLTAAVHPQWIFTRSFNSIRGPRMMLAAESGELAVNLSADVDNYQAALDARERSRYLYRVCYLTTDGAIPDDLPAGSVIFPDYGLRRSRMWWRQLSQEHRRAVCGADYFGQSRSQRCGVCTKCFI